MNSRVSCLAAVVAVLACSPGDQVSDDTSTPVDRGSSSAAVRVPVSELGVGPLRIGMTVAQARSALPGLEVPKESEEKGCGYARGGGLAPGVSVMIEDGTVVRIDVETSAITTADGARVGDSTARVTSIYGARLSSSPNKYTAEPDLTVRAANTSDTTHELIFETVKGRVVRYRGGQRPQVRYVERCG
jgi:hypothetical protein